MERIMSDRREDHATDYAITRKGTRRLAVRLSSSPVRAWTVEGTAGGCVFSCAAFFRLDPGGVRLVEREPAYRRHRDGRDAYPSDLHSSQDSKRQFGRWPARP